MWWTACLDYSGWERTSRNSCEISSSTTNSTSTNMATICRKSKIGLGRTDSIARIVRSLYPIDRWFMWGSDFLKAIRPPEHRLAWLVAMAADAIQIFALPLFAGGGLSPADTLLDVATAAILIRCLGWHWAFLPTLLAEMIPGLDLFPTWTAAVFYVTYQRVRAGEPEILPPGPAPARRPYN